MPSRQALTCDIQDWSGPHDAVWVSFAGRVDMDSAPAFRRQLDKLVNTGPAGLLVELREITYMDSSGVAVLVECLQWCHDHAVDFVLLAPSKAVRESTEVFNLGDVFDTVEHPSEFADRLAAADASSSDDHEDS